MTCPTQVNYTTTSVPDYIAPCLTSLMGKVRQVTCINANPYMQYQGCTVAQFSPLQQEAFNNAATMQTSGQLKCATAMAGQAGLAGLNAGYTYNPYSASQINAPSITGAQLQGAPLANAAQMQGPGNVSTGNFTNPGTAMQYMNPYLQSSLAPQIAMMQQQQAQQQQQNQAAAVGQGAFGGTRCAVLTGAQNQANQLAQQNLVGNAYNQAYKCAESQFSTCQARNLQAQQANQGMNYNTSLQNAQMLQQSGLANQSLMGQYGLQQGQFNQAANLADQQANLTAQQSNQSANQAAANLNAQQGQFGANLGMQGINAANTAANTLNTLGNSQYNQNLGITGVQSQMGAAQQQQAQNVLNQQYQCYLNYKNYPYQQLSFQSNILHGLPMTNTTSQTYTAPPSTLSQVAGAGITAAGLGAFKSAKGGAIKEKKQKSNGLVDLAIAKMG